MRFFLAGLIALVLAPTASAAEIRADRGCYYQTPQTTVSLRGAGFAAAAPYLIAVDGERLPGPPQVTAADGTFSGAFQPASLKTRDPERRSTLSVRSGDLTASTTFTVTRLFATFTPTRGVPSTLRVRFSVYGLGLDGSHPDVYVHYVAPGTARTRATRSVRLGRSAGQCGSIPRTAKRRLFPFPLTRYGRWILQFDNNETYRRGVTSASGASAFAFYSLGVCVRPPGARAPRAGQPCPIYA